MKLKILVKLVEKILNVSVSDDTPRADVYLPERLLAMGLVGLAGGVALGVFFAFTLKPWALIAGIVALLLGMAATMCWRNQMIRVISDTQFEYTTMFGHTYTYNFSDITALRQNKDSLTLFVKNKKVHIESMAIISERFATLVNEQLKK